MNAHDKQVLEKILRHAAAIVSYCDGCSDCDEFQNQPMLVDAVVFNLMQIGELAKSELSEETKTAAESIPWKQLYGMRNRIVHGYSGVRMSIVWDTIREDIPRLKEQLEKLLCC